MIQIFISYSHKDKKWKDRLVRHLKVIEFEGFCCLWEDKKISLGGDWLPEIETALNKAQIVIMMISADFLISDFIRTKEVPLILERRQKDEVLVIPFIIKPSTWELVEWLSKMQVEPGDGKPLSGRNDHEIEMELANLVRKIYNFIKENKTFSNAMQLVPNRQPDHLMKYVETVYIKPKKKTVDIFLSKLPNTGAKLFGRKKELEILDEVWDDEHTHMIILVAWGGVGKTTLVNHWLNLMGKDNFRGAKRVYGWSFYSKGAVEGKQASADEFMQETLKWFGDKDETEGSSVDKGRRLSSLIREERTLLILDGLESLQYPPGEGHGLDGQVKDQGLKTLLKELAIYQPGMCVITSRETLTDLLGRIDFTVKEIHLEHLSDKAGMQLLKSLKTKGSNKKILAAVREYDGHALALTLLGRYLCSVYKGDINQKDNIPIITKEKGYGGHARRVMEAYEKWLGESPELDILRMMGLFDGPAEGGAIEVLKKGLPIPGVSQQLQELSPDDWQYALTNLRDANLLTRENPQKPNDLDCHPLIREHFNQKLMEKNPDGWKTAHKRLYHFYKDLPLKEFPDTLTEMEPLFEAIVHGCQAGLHNVVLDEVYGKRILRKDEFFITRKLGAFGANLSALSHFFKAPWDKPVAGLTDLHKANLLSWSGFDLRAVGRLQEASQPMKVALDVYIKQESWIESAREAGNLSELMLLLGQVNQAVGYAKQCVIYADRSGDNSWKMGLRTTLADALHQSGRLPEAEKLFLEAEAMQKENQPKYQFLYALQGFRFCDLLLGQGRYQEVMKRAGETLKWGENQLGLLSNSLGKLSLGKAWLMYTKKEKSADFTRVRDLLNQAVAGLREAGVQHHLPRGLFARAEFYRLQKEFSEAGEDLKEAKEIVELGSMSLFEADYHLEAGRLCLEEGKRDEGQSHMKTAKIMIKKMGYHRRNREVEELESKIKNLNSVK